MNRTIYVKFFYFSFFFSTFFFYTQFLVNSFTRKNNKDLKYAIAFTFFVCFIYFIFLNKNEIKRKITEKVLGLETNIYFILFQALGLNERKKDNFKNLNVNESKKKIFFILLFVND